eukprot:TRINITY_DN1735_c0_g1_i2.p1 TRINITY_DN1735_c0_g1~~TRINITY_DN1735_c0_g1_i2.p1  ORF type:complete len:536 (-),score=120.13 TRINITY_DN1735_c0_g1_i2:357-1964(-)
MEGSEYPLHRAVWLHDLALVRDLVEIKQRPLDEQDLHGNTALHLAVILGDRAIVNYLLSKHADPRKINRSGWSVMKEASSASDPVIFASLVLMTRRRTLEKWMSRIPSVMDRLEHMPDFELKLKWEFSSWIPFLSRLCPSDVYTIRKKGSTVRMDTTIVDFESYRWIRGNVSFWFMGKDSDTPGKLKIVDHDKETVTNLSISTSEIDVRHFKEEIDTLIKADTFRTDTRSSQTAFSQQYTWFGWGGERVENIEGYNCKVFDMKDLEYAVFVRPRMRSAGGAGPSGSQDASSPAASPPVSHNSSGGDSVELPCISMQEYFDPQAVEAYNGDEGNLTDTYEYVQEKGSLSTEDVNDLQKIELEIANEESNTSSVPDLSESESDSRDDSHPSGLRHVVPIDSLTMAQLEHLFSEKESIRHTIPRYPGKATKKNIKAKWWLSQDFPLRLDQLTPLLEILAPTSQHFGKLQTFLSSKFPDAGFPVRVEIPIVPAALKAYVTFSGFEWRTVSESEVRIPQSYVEQIDSYSPSADQASADSD